MKTFFNIYRCSYHLWGHFSGRDIFPLGIIFFLPERFLNVLCGVILLVIKMSTIFYAWKCLYFTFERCILWKRISKLLTATFFPLRSLRIFLLDSIISDEKSSFIFTFVPLYKTQLLSLTALNFSLKRCFFFFFWFDYGAPSCIFHVSCAWGFWICGSIVFISCGKILVTIFHLYFCNISSFVRLQKYIY